MTVYEWKYLQKFTSQEESKNEYKRIESTNKDRRKTFDL